MSELQATLEFSVELNKFYNVDLFQRGYYQIRTALKTPPKVPSKIEITLQRSQGDDEEIPAHVINDMAVSKTFQILYKNEDVILNDVILYRFHTLVNSTQLEDELSKLEIELALELWFADDDYRLSGESSSRLLAKAECVSQRLVNIHISPTKGLHHHVPILFDYFHLSALELTVHGTLIAIHQPFLSVPKQPKSAWSSRNPDQSTLETVYFGDRPLSAEPDRCQPLSLHAAWQMHHRICNILLSGYESLQATFETFLSDICGSQFKLEHIDCHNKLEKIMDGIRHHDNEEEMIQNATRDITQLCAANVILWTQFLETATLDQGIIFHLAKEHHTSKIKRLAEGFFFHENQKNECLDCYEPSYHGHSDLAAMVRSSMYLQTLPPIDLECLDLDGDNNSLPIIFEDIYFDQSSLSDTRSSRSGSLSPSMTSNCSPQLRSKPKRSFIMNIRPDSFKRPSSFNLKEAEAASSRAQKDVVLVGYRKTTASPNVHSKVIVNNLQLGTLSPSPASSDAYSPQVPIAMSNSVSMPSLTRSDWTRNSDGTLPEYMQVARRSLRAKKKNRKGGKPSIITVDFGGSDPDIQRSDSDAEEDSRHKLKRADTDPSRCQMVNPSRCSVDKDSLPSFSKDSSNLQSSDRSSDNSSDITGVSDTCSSIASHSTPQSDQTISHPAKKQLNFQQELYKNLSECLTKALGDEELNDSDKSDDETCIQNGYDEFLEVDTSVDSSHHPDYVKCQHGVQPPTESGAQASSNLAKSGDDQSEPSNPQTTTSTGLTVRDVLKLNALQLTPAGDRLKAQPEQGTGANNIVMNGNVPKELEDVLSVSDINVARDSARSTEEVGSDSKDSGVASTGSRNASTANSISIVTERDFDTDSEKVTVIELLREEYQRHATSISSDFSDSGVSGVSVKNNYKSSSDSNLLQSVDMQHSDMSLEVKKSGDAMVTSASFPDMSKLQEEPKQRPKLVDKVGRSTVSFISMRENLKARMKYQGHLYSETATLASQIPYFHVPDTTEDENQDGCHLVVCVHGLDGNSKDLRLVKIYMEMSLPGYRLEFLMSERNQADTFAEFDSMTQTLVNEILHYIEMHNLKVARVSFVGHSLGTIIIRSALAHVDMIPLLPKLYTFLSLSGPHLGTLYNNSGLVNMGMWFMQKWKKSGSLLQLSLKDNVDPRQSFLYKLSQKPGLEFFKNVLLVGSSQDRYVPYHSSRIEMCKAAQRESSGLGAVYAEMVANILQPIVSNPKCKLIRYDVFHALPSTANTVIGRAAHIAVLDSEIFIEKFLMVCALKYFK